VAVEITDPNNTDIWVSELARNTLSKVTTDPAYDGRPLWTLDSERIVFWSERDGGVGLFSKAADGRGAVEPLLTLDEDVINLTPDGWSPDMKELVVHYASESRPFDVGVLSMDGERDWTVLLGTEANEVSPMLSPDGSLIAYHSRETGRDEVYVERFPVLGNKRKVSTAGGADPIWSPDGSELFYRERGSGFTMVVTIDTEPILSPGRPEVVFEQNYFDGGGRRYDLHPDGQRFLVIKAPGATSGGTSEPAQIILIQNWSTELQRLVPSP